MKLFCILILVLLTTFKVSAQTPEKMSYQAIVRASDNSLVSDSSVSLRIIVRQGSENGMNTYEETHSATTNANGLVSLEIGTGNVVSGSFKSIDWENGPYFIEIQVDPTGRSNYSVIGVSQLLSVPYALHAKSATSITGAISASQLTDMDLYEPVGTEVAFDKWDKDTSDDFSGSFKDLTQVPDLYTKNQVDSLMLNLDGKSGVLQSLNFEGETLSISGGNSISFENWDTDASNDFDGEYSSLKNVPKMYTQAEVDSIEKEILKKVEASYSKRAKIFPITYSRNISSSDVGNTIACTVSATLTIPSGFSAMEVGDIINLEVHGTTLTVQGSGVIVNGVGSGNATIGNDKAYTGGILRKTGTYTYIVL